MMRPEWTGNACKVMHINGIGKGEIADKLGWTTPYFSDVINGKKTPAGAEERVMGAINAIIAERNKE